MDLRALELATFIQKMVQVGNLPKLEAGTGGVVLVGWSIGHLFATDFLARISQLPVELQNVLRTYVRGYVVYGEDDRWSTR